MVGGFKAYEYVPFSTVFGGMFGIRMIPTEQKTWGFVKEYSTSQIAMENRE